MTFPKTYGAADAPVEVLQLAKRLVPLLLEGPHPALSVLRRQLLDARVKQVELTGVGFYLDFDVPSYVPLAEPANLAGGDAKITIQGFEHPAGCVLFVRGGRLETLEVYTYGSDAWPERLLVVAIDDVFPLPSEKAG
jgi:hypothetical protein